MADNSDRLARVAELAQKRDRRLVRAQVVRVGHPAGKDDAVELRRVGVRDLAVGLEFVALVEVVEGLHLLTLR